MTLCLQVLMTRHTVMVVGQTGGGKSVILQTLARSQTKMGKRTTMNVLNPKVGLKTRILPLRSKTLQSFWLQQSRNMLDCDRAHTCRGLL